MRVQHNIPAMNAYRNYNSNSSGINKNLEKLSSGYKINRAGDDAAGLAISEKMRAQITGLEVAQKNAKDGISLVQTAEGALTEVQDMLNRMYKLAEQSANGTYAGDGTDATKIDREQLNKEVNKLRDEIDRIANTANFNGTKLLDNSLSANSTNNNGGGPAGTPYVDSSDTTKITLESAGTVLEDLAGKSITATVTAGSGYNLVSFDNSSLSGYTVSYAKNAGSTGSGGVSGSAAQSTAGLVDVTITDSADSSKTTTVTLDLTNAEVGSFELKFSDGTEESGNNGGVSDTVGTAATAMGDTPKSYSTSGLVLWIGAEADTNNALTVNIDGIRSSDLAITSSTVDITTQGGALTSLRYIEAAIDKVSDIRGELGATQNRLEHTINNLSVMQENMQDAESTIRDTDVAEEMMKYTKNSILVQSAQAMLAQANQLPQGVLQLLQ